MAKLAHQVEAQETADEVGCARLLARFALRIWPLLLGNMMQWYEFAIFGYLATQIQGNFFRGSTVAMWLGFAVTFVSRPFGGFVFGWFADHIGRRDSTVASILGMTLATVGQGLLPSGYCCGPGWGGVGVGLLVVLRLLQGLCAAGDEAAIVPYMAESAPGRVRCLATSIFMVTCCSGFLLASGAALLLSLALDAEQAMLWGWRIPFLICLVPGLLSLWGRRHLPESPEFLAWKAQRERRAQEERLTEDGLPVSKKTGGLAQGLAACKEHATGMALVLFGLMQSGIAFYQAVWCISYAKAHGLPGSAAPAISSLMWIVTMATLVLTAAVSDARGQGPYPALLLGALCTLVGWLPLFHIVTVYPSNPFIVGACVSLGFGVLLGLQNGTHMLFYVGCFPTGSRGRLFGLMFNLAAAVFGGFAGAISQALLSLSPTGPAIYTLCGGLISVSTLVWAGKAQVRGTLQVWQPSVPSSSSSSSSSSADVPEPEAVALASDVAATAEV